MQLFSTFLRFYVFLKKIKLIFDLENIKKPPQKVAYLWQLGLFFSLQPRLPKTAQNFISVLSILLCNHLF